VRAAACLRGHDRLAAQPTGLSRLTIQATRRRFSSGRANSNEHVNFHDFVKHVRGIPGERGGASLFFVEDLAYQKAAFQVASGGSTVRQKLHGAFPTERCEQLLALLFGFGVEAHDDLVDGFSYLLLGLVNQGLKLPKIHWIEGVIFVMP
jgi:hypothetical protein